MKRIILDGEILEITSNDYGGITIVVRNVHGDGKSSNREYVNAYNKYGETLVDKKVIAVGDAIVVEYEEKTVLQTNKDTGAEEWKTKKVGVSVHRTLRPKTSPAPQDAPVELSDETGGLNTDTF